MSNGLDPDQERHSVVLIWVQIVAKVISRREKHGELDLDI